MLVVAPSGARAEDAAGSPVTKVVELIQELKAKIEADGKTEQKVYDKFACWCEKTTARKAAAIEKAKADIEAMQQLILELKAKVATLGAEIAQLEKDIAGMSEALKEAAALREKENAEYLKERSETEQCIGALEHAIKTLQGAGTGKASVLQKGVTESALQQAELDSAAAGVRSALRRVPKDTMTPEDMRTVQDFVQDPTRFWSSSKTSFSGAQIAQNPFGDYAPASTVIQGILKEMYDGFTSSLEEANADEASKAKEFEDLYGIKAAEVNTLESTLAKKSEDKAESEKTLADTKEQLTRRRSSSRRTRSSSRRRRRPARRKRPPGRSARAFVPRSSRAWRRRSRSSAATTPRPLSTVPTRPSCRSPPRPQRWQPRRLRTLCAGRPTPQSRSWPRATAACASPPSQPPSAPLRAATLTA
jgi:predicted  nucleic acid-binding Zn-ribbon protein